MKKKSASFLKSKVSNTKDAQEDIMDQTPYLIYIERMIYLQKLREMRHGVQSQEDLEVFKSCRISICKLDFEVQ